MIAKTDSGTITLLSEKEVFGFTKEEEQIVEVLKKCKLPGDFRGDKLKALQEKGLSCSITDLVLLLGGDKDCIGLIDSVSEGDCVLAYSNSRNTRTNIGNIERRVVIRPILNIPEEIDLSMVEDCSEIEYGEFPQVAASMDMQEKLEQELINKSDKMEELDESYSLVTDSIYSSTSSIHPQKYPVILYEGKKYIRVPNRKYSERVLSNGMQLDKCDLDYCWIEVSPIKWIIDKSSRKLIPKNGLITNISFSRDSIQRYSTFTDSQVYDYLVHCFLPEILQSTRKKELGNTNQEEEKIDQDSSTHRI